MRPREVRKTAIRSGVVAASAPADASRPVPGDAPEAGLATTAAHGVRQASEGPQLLPESAPERADVAEQDRVEGPRC